MNSTKDIQKAIHLAKKGDTAHAISLLKDVIARDDKNETAWLALAYLLPARREKMNCLRQVLKINPENTKARQQLDRLQSDLNTPTQQSKDKSDKKNQKRSLILRASAWIVWGLAAILVISTAGVGIGFLLFSIYTSDNTVSGFYASPPPLQSITSEPDLIANAANTPTVAVIANINDKQYIDPLISASSTATAFQTANPTETHTCTPNKTASATATASASTTPSPTLTPSFTPTPTQTPSPTATPTEQLPTSAFVLNIKGSDQSLPLSCEANSATDWAAFFGKTIRELEFFSKLPVSDDPDVGFVGNVNGVWGQIPPNPYGVHAGPVASLLREYGVNAVAVKDFTWDNLRREIAANRPVIVWVVGKVWSNIKPVNYTSRDGHTTIVAPYEHTVMVIGYDEEGVTILDGYIIYNRTTDKFLKSWAVLGSMAIIQAPK